MSWLIENYDCFDFFVERDVVWTLQKWLTNIIREKHLPLRVFNDFPMLPGRRRSLSTDLAIVDQERRVLLAAELKYEPSHARTDILESKFPVVSWGKDGVGKDVERVREFVASDRTAIAYAYFIDEGGHFRHRPPHPGARWRDCGEQSTKFRSLSVLESCVQA